MKELVKFSLKRRFLNTATMLLNGLLLVVILGAFFADKLVELVNPTLFDDRVVYLRKLDDTISTALMESEQSGLTFVISEETPEKLLEETPNALVLDYEQGYKLTTLYQADELLVNAISALLSQTHQNLALSSLVSSVEEYESIMMPILVMNEAINPSINLSEGRQNLVFMVITSIYFTMLSFSTTVANEVIYEKSTKTLELILTSVSAKTHFLSKMVVGWLAIFVQISAVCLYGFVGFVVRNFYDQGLGLIELVNKMGLITLEGNTFAQVFSTLHVEFDFVLKCCFILAFLYIGILFIQMILVVLSSFIANVEEAGNIQAPFYLILMGVYYFALSVNTPYQMSEGIGFFLSFFPFFSMLFMPCRLLIQEVSLFELLLSLMISLAAIMAVVKEGSRIYQHGVLDYSNKGFLGVIKGVLSAPERE